MKVLNLCLVIFCFTCALSVSAEAFSKITVTRLGDGSYAASATDLVSAGAIDFYVSFDPIVLTNPVVSKTGIASGSDVEVSSSIENPGVLRVILFCKKTAGINGSGQIATITFKKIGTAADMLAVPTQQQQQASIVSQEGTLATVEMVVSTAPQSADTGLITSTGGVGTKTSQPTSGGMSNIFSQAQQQAAVGGMTDVYNQAQQQQQQQSGSYQGSVTISGNTPLQQTTGKEALQRGEARRVENKSNDQRNVAQTSAPRAETASASSMQVDNTKSPKVNSAIDALTLLKAAEMPVQRFRAYKGTHTVKGLASLFDEGALGKAGIVQVPEIAVSDGNMMVTVKIEFAASGVVPNFSLRGANLKSIRTISDKVWELDALPKKGKYDVHLSVSLGKELVDIPLVVIPPLDVSIVKATQNLDEAGVGALLAKAESNTGKLVYDLNSDGRQDFLDDYILVAHYLLKMQKTAKPNN